MWQWVYFVFAVLFENAIKQEVRNKSKREGKSPTIKKYYHINSFTCSQRTGLPNK